MKTDKMVFVFGSNEGGIHGSGAARFAYKERGARWGFSYGHMGQSFAIPTKGFEININNDPVVGNTLHLFQIQMYVKGFLAYAMGHPELNFQVTCIGCGLAGLKHHQIAPMFNDASFWGNIPENVFFDEKWRSYLPTKANFWGEG